MNQTDAGAMIKKLRLEKGMTQRKLAEQLFVSDKAVSKWERGLGMPDIVTLPLLSRVLGADLTHILEGNAEPSRVDGGNMKRIRFFTCPECGNVTAMTGTGEVSCCGRRLLPLMPRPMDEAHRITATPSYGELHITFPHPMEKGHHIRFVAHVNWERALLVRLYPEQGGELRMPACRGGKFYVCCSRDGLWEL